MSHDGDKRDDRRILVTSALPYINATKHLGNLAGSILPADVFARFCRMSGAEVLFLCATDEHGTPTELAAAAAGVSPREFAETQFAAFKKTLADFAISTDWFGRTSSPQNAQLVQHFAARLEEHNLIEERDSVQLYSPDDGRFLPDRYVEGECPRCGAGGARGDQCEACGALLDPLELIRPKSKISGSTRLEPRRTRHLFLLQSKMRTKIRDWVDRATGWPPLASSIAYKWLDEGLQDRSITRDLQWGIPVCKDGNVRPGFENKVFYVWFDAPIEYIAAAVEWAGDDDAKWRRWWRTDQGADDVKYVQFMGKDNVAFHTVSFPVTIIGSEEPWKLVDVLKAFNWVTWYGDKFSTSQQRGIFLDQALELLPADYWRWYLVANSPENSDAPFTLEHFQASVNSDLADVYGNFVNRVLAFCATHFEGKIPERGELKPADADALAAVSLKCDHIYELLDNMEFRRAAAEIRATWALGNEYITRSEPWKIVKSDRIHCATVLNVAVHLVGIFSKLAWPIIPVATTKVLEALGQPVSVPAWPSGDEILREQFVVGRVMGRLPPLFQKVSKEDVETWKGRFGSGHV